MVQCFEEGVMCETGEGSVEVPERGAGVMVLDGVDDGVVFYLYDVVDHAAAVKKSLLCLCEVW